MGGLSLRRDARLVKAGIYKALKYFVPAHKDKKHGDHFRRRLAWAFMTLGKVEYPNDKDDEHPFDRNNKWLVER
eukprot:4135860-Pleurochrysis_carterae.AAC.1